MTNEERIIEYVNNELSHSRDNTVLIDRTDLNKIGLSEQEVVRSIYLLKKDGFLNIMQKSTHEDLSVFWKLSLEPKCIYYFQGKDKERKMSNKEKRSETMSWITLIVAILALFASIFSIYLQFFRSSDDKSQPEILPSETATTLQMYNEGVSPTMTN